VFITLNPKSIIVIITILFTFSLTFISSSEVESMIKTNSQIKSSSNSLLKIKSNSKLSLKKKKYSINAPPGADLNLNSQISQPAITSQASVPSQGSAPSPAASATTSTTTVNPSNKNSNIGKIQATKGNGDVIFNDWLQISSKSFHLQYNEIEMGFHGPNVKILTNSNDFRVNDAFAKDINSDNQPPSAELFWFRLTKDLIFYSSTKHDLNLLGGIKISEIIRSEPDKKGIEGEFCFQITDNGNRDWEICSVNQTIRNMWFCKIQELRKDTLPLYCQNDNDINKNDNTKVVIKNVKKKNK
jgi:hypothetical protein